MSDGCCHRLEPWCQAFCDIFPLCLTSEGTIYQRAEIIPEPFFLAGLPKKKVALFKFANSAVSIFYLNSVDYTLMLFTKIEYEESRAESIQSKKAVSCNASKLWIYLFKSCHVLFSYDDDDDIDNIIYMVEERFLKSLVVFWNGS